MRKAFVQKVYGIVATQLAATGAVVAFLRSMPHVPFEILRRLGPLFFLLPLGPLLMLQLMPNTRTSGSASAYLLLAAFTILQATVIGVATLGVPLQLVLRAATVTAVATGGLSLYALTTRRDFTMAGGLLVSGIIALFSFFNCVGLFPTFDGYTKYSMGPRRPFIHTSGSKSTILLSSKKSP